MSDLDTFQRNIEQLDSNEIERRLATGIYEDERHREIAKQVVQARKRQQDDSRTERRDRFARRAVIAAWISATCAVLSAISTIINVILTHSKHP